MTCRSDTRQEGVPDPKGVVRFLLKRVPPDQELRIRSCHTVASARNCAGSSSTSSECRTTRRPATHTSLT